MTKKLHLVSLGCAKNLVDSEAMLGRLKKAGWIITQNPAEAETIIVNTCSFIEPAVNESIDTILELASLKKNGSLRCMIVAGCLPERFREEIINTLPEVDIFLGTGAYDKIVQAAEGSLNCSKCMLPDPNSIPLPDPDAPRVLSDSCAAYIKIAEGCSSSCTYCIIPKLRGKQRSRTPESIVSEARFLISAKVRELILVSQDTTNYGRDLGARYDLTILLERISELSGDVWIRVLYGHPASINDSIIRTITTHHNICSYFDIPIQHASNSVLKRMGRHYTRTDLYRLFDNIRSIAPDAALRTTAIVGFPGEKDEDFQQLLDFVKDIRFDNLGVFLYSDFHDLPSHGFTGHVPKKVAKKRYDRLMSCQLEISTENNRKYIDRVYNVLVEASSEENLFLGRTSFQAPEVDGVTFIKAKQLPVGRFARVKITDAYEYDLSGEVVCGT